MKLKWMNFSKNLKLHIFKGSVILDNKKLYTDKRWNQPLGGKIIGTAKPLTEEEQKKVDEEFEEFIAECEREIAKYHENKD